MATIKSHTDLEQSKKLFEILSTESADHFHIIGHHHTDGPRYEVIRSKNEVSDHDSFWPCWSLAALLNVLPSATLDSSDNHHYRVHCKGRYTEWKDNAVDACVEMIIRLNELKIFTKK